MELPSQIYAFFVLVVLRCSVREVDALNYASFDSGDGNFKLRWTYNPDNSKLIFNMTCKTTGWCAVGFTKSTNGKSMVNYDIAVAGVASNTPYINGYHSKSIGTPTKDPTHDYGLIKATEDNRYTNVQFDRSATTDEQNDPDDIQFKEDTEVWIVWAWRENDDANSGLNANLKHSHTGVSPKKHNLIMEAKSAGKQENTASHVGPCVLAYAILAFIMCLMSF